MKKKDAHNLNPELRRYDDVCRFMLFCRLKPDAEYKFCGGTKDVFTFRGDRYEKEDLPRMLQLLLNQFKKYHHQYKVCILYDNTIAKDTPGREIFKYTDGVVDNETNRLDQYQKFLEGYSLPIILQK